MTYYNWEQLALLFNTYPKVCVSIYFFLDKNCNFYFIIIANDLFDS